MSVAINSFLRTPAGPVPIADVERYDGDPQYVEGSIVLDVDGCELLSHDLWDDVDMLWPFVVQAVDEALRTGSGERYFPDQPILFGVKSQGSRILLTVKGSSNDRAVSADRGELLHALGAGALAFFAELGFMRRIDDWLRRRNGNGNDGDPDGDGTPGTCAAGSFSASTPVLMADGTRKPIGQVAVGDLVLATDPTSGLVFNDDSSIARTQPDGRVVRESLLAGPQGLRKLETIWEGDN